MTPRTPSGAADTAGPCQIPAPGALEVAKAPGVVTPSISFSSVHLFSSASSLEGSPAPRAWMDSTQLPNSFHPVTRTAAVYSPSLLWLSPRICLISVLPVLCPSHTPPFCLLQSSWSAVPVLEFYLAFFHFPRLHLFLSLIWVFSFLNLPFRGKMGQTSISDLSNRLFPTWASLPDHTYLSVPGSDLATGHLPGLLSFIHVWLKNTGQSYTALPHSSVGCGFTGPFFILLTASRVVLLGSHLWFSCPQYCVLPAVHQTMC